MRKCVILQQIYIKCLLINVYTMAGYLVDDTRKVTTNRLMDMKKQGKKIVNLANEIE